MSSVVKTKVSGLSEANDGDLPQNSSLLWRVVLSARAQIQMDQSELRVSGRCLQPVHKRLRKAEEANFKAIFSLFTSLSATKAHVLRVTFIGLYGTVVFIAIRDFSC